MSRISRVIREAVGFAISGATGAATAWRLIGGNASGAPTSGTWLTNDVAFDATGALWVCTAGGTPGTWRRMGIHETMQDHGNIGSTETVDLANGTYHRLVRDAACTLTLQGWPAAGIVASMTIKFVHSNDATTRTVTWPAAVKWPGGSAPILTETANAVDFVSLWTDDGGTTIYGGLVGNDFK